MKQEQMNEEKEKFRKNMKEFEERYNREHTIICPYCNEEQDEETKHNYVTYWGEDEDKECTCDSCEKSFMVKENVDRTFETYTLEVVKNG